MPKKKKIFCNSCKCSTLDNNKIKITCSGILNNDDISIICKSCNCIYDAISDKKELCLKECENDNSTIYITCTEYYEDLD